MSNETERQVVNVIAPKQSATAGEGVAILAATTTAKQAAVPDELLSAYVYLQAEGDKIWVNFSPSSETTDIDKSAAGGVTFAAGTALGNAVPIPDGARIAVRLTKGQHDLIKWQANSTNSKLIVYKTTPRAKTERGARGFVGG